MALFGSMVSSHADTSASSFTPDVAKFLPTVANPYQRAYEAGLPAIIQKNVAAMHQIQRLSVDLTFYGAGKTPDTDKPDSTYHIAWQQPDRASIRQYRDGKLVAEQVADGTYHWQWSGGIPPAVSFYMKSDMRPANTPKGTVMQFSDIGGVYDQNIGMICRPDGLLFSSSLKDLGEITTPGSPTVHRVSLGVGQRAAINPKTQKLEFVDVANQYDLDTTSGLPCQMTTSDSATIVYSHYQINAALPSDTFTVQNPDAYTYYPSAALPVRPGSPAPDFALRDGDSKPVSLSALRGQTVLLCFVSPYYNPPNSLADALQALSHYIDPSQVTVALVTDRPLTGDGLRGPFLSSFTDWSKQHPFLTKFYIVDDGKGFGEKIQERIVTRYGLSGESAVLIDKRGVIQAVYDTDYPNGQTRLQSLGKTEADDKVLKGTATMDSALAAQIATLSAQ